MTDQLSPGGAVGPGLVSWFESFEVLAAEPGRLREMVGRKFEVVRHWGHQGPRGLAGRPVLQTWVPGVRGTVDAVVFTSHSGWEVELELDGDCVGLEIDEIMPRVPLAAFLRATAPLRPYSAAGAVFPREAANDPR